MCKQYVLLLSPLSRMSLFSPCGRFAASALNVSGSTHVGLDCVAYSCVRGLHIVVLVLYLELLWTSDSSFKQLMGSWSPVLKSVRLTGVLWQGFIRVLIPLSYSNLSLNGARAIDFEKVCYHSFKTNKALDSSSYQLSLDQSSFGYLFSLKLLIFYLLHGFLAFICSVF